MILAANGLDHAFGIKPAENFDSQLRSDPADSNQPLEEPLFVGLQKPEQSDLALAYLRMYMQRGLGAHRGQRRKRGHGDGDVVPDTASLDNSLAGLLVNELAAQVSDHSGPIVELQCARRVPPA